MGVETRLSIEGKLAGDFAEDCVFVSNKAPNPGERIGTGEVVQPSSADLFDCDAITKPRRFRVLVNDKSEIEVTGYGVCAIASDPQHLGILANAHDSSTFVAVFLAAHVIGIYPADAPSQ